VAEATPRIAITGCGILAPGGVRDLAGLAVFLRANRSAIRPMAEGEWPGLPAGTPAARLDGFDVAAALAALPAAGRRAARGASRGAVAALAAAAAALDEAAPADAAGFGVVVAGSNIGADRALAAARKWLDTPEWTPPRHAHEAFDTHLAALAGESFGLHGPALSVGGASASGNTALAVAADLVAMRRMPGCLVLAPPPGLSPVEWQALASIGALAPPGRVSRPFDAASAGLAPGEVAAAVVIEPLAAARARGATVLAEIAGHAQAQQGRTGTAPDSATALHVMRAALADAGIEASSLGFVAAHATGTPAGDAAEAAALGALLAGCNVPVNAPKALLGHAIQGAALVACLACVAQLRGGFVHGTHAAAPPASALSPAFGFGGIATALVLRAVTEDA
jgi:malonyl-ACP decarboxylase